MFVFVFVFHIEPDVSQYRLNKSRANGQQTSWLLGHIPTAQENFHILLTVVIMLF